jgi:hypothetical protein
MGKIEELMTALRQSTDADVACRAQKLVTQRLGKYDVTRRAQVPR